MKQFIKSFLGLCVIAPLCAAHAGEAARTNAATAARTDALMADNTVIARAKGVEVKRSELDTEVVNAKRMSAARGIAPPPELEKQLLKGLIIKKIILNKATDADKAKAREQFQNSIERFKTNNNLTDEQFNQRLSQELVMSGQTRSQWEQQSVEQATVPLIVERELNINVTDEAAKKFYDENPAEFEQPEAVRVSHILLITEDPATKEPLPDDKKQAKRKQIEDLLKRARAGEDFHKLADQYSEDPAVKENHGEYTLSRNDRFVQEFKDAAFALNTTNQVSDVVTTQFGYHILKLHEKIPAKKLEFDKIKPDLKVILAQRQMQNEFIPYTQKLEKEANIEILDPALKIQEPSLPNFGTNRPPARP